MSSRPRLVLALVLAVSLASARAPERAQGYVAAIGGADTSATAARPAGSLARLPGLPAGAEVGGFLSPRGLPPQPGRFVVTDSGLVFHSSDGGTTQLYALVGPVRVRDGRRWRASMVSLAYADSAQGRPVYIFRVDGGVFMTESPGALLDVAARPSWLDSVTSRPLSPDKPLVSHRDSAGIWRTTHEMVSSGYADTLYALFGRPARPAGLVGNRGRHAGRLGEYIASRDSLALDPARMTSTDQLRHAVAHEMAHRWQARSPGQLRTLWQGIRRIPDSRRYGHGSVSEHQAEAVAFAVHFLGATAAATADSSAAALLDQYELLVPGTGAMARYLALQPIYGQHPLHRMLTTGNPGLTAVSRSTAASD